MDKAKTAKVQIDVSQIPEPVMIEFTRRTLKELVRIRQEQPEVWAKIEARAAEIRKERESANGGGK